jgi:two-component system nitrogen regulation response regulator NtrX
MEVAVMAVVVVADDDAEVRDIMAQILGDEGHTAVLLRECRHVVTMLTDGKAAALIIDPRWGALLTGLEVLQEVAAVEELHALPVLVCSAAIEALQKHTAWLRAHGYDTLAKPFDLDDVLSWVHQHIEAAQIPPTR